MLPDFDSDMMRGWFLDEVWRNWLFVPLLDGSLCFSHFIHFSASSNNLAVSHCTPSFSSPQHNMHHESQ